MSKYFIKIEAGIIRPNVLVCRRKWWGGYEELALYTSRERGIKEAIKLAKALKAELEKEEL